MLLILAGMLKQKCPKGIKVSSLQVSSCIFYGQKSDASLKYHIPYYQFCFLHELHCRILLNIEILCLQN